jgi:formate C-acetyltransferase
VLPDGSDATNDLTRLFLQAIRSVRLLRPTIYLRCHEHTPAEVLELAVEMLGEGLAEPSFYGDAPVLCGLQRLGVPLEQARDYALSGCTEIVLPGQANWGAPNGWINLALLVDEAIKEFAEAAGPVTHDVTPAALGAERLWDIITRRAEELAELCRVCNEYVDEARQDGAYNSCLLMPVCLEKCQDIVHGGAGSYMGHWEAMGLPNAADMLLAVERLAFDSGESLPELLQALDTDDPALRKRLSHLPRFGNGEQAVDELAARLVRVMSEALERRSTRLRSHLVLGHLAGGENMHLAYGMLMGPTLDGRRDGETLADSLAGTQGQTRQGPTAVVRSLCRLDHSRLVAGNVSTLRLLPADFADEESRPKVVALIRTFVALGGSQLQINVVDADTLRAAQADPEAYEGLMVRVAGYSADFTRMGKTLQDEMIQRLCMSEGEMAVH